MFNQNAFKRITEVYIRNGYKTVTPLARQASMQNLKQIFHILKKVIIKKNGKSFPTKHSGNLFDNKSFQMDFSVIWYTLIYVSMLI